jgi:hypothetical protein
MDHEPYVLPPEEAAKLPICQRLLDLAPETSRIRAEEFGFGLLIYALYRRGVRTFEAVLLLCRNGFGDQALMLARVLFEDMVDAHWVNADPDLAVERFDDAALLAHHHQEERAAPYAQQLEGLLPEQPLAERLTEEQRARLQQLLGQRQVVGSWTRIGMRARVDAVRDEFGSHAPLLQMFWQLGEGQASDFVHSSPQSLYSQIDLTSKRPGGVDFFVGPSGRHVGQALLLAGWSFLHLLSLVYEQAELDGEVLGAAHDEFWQICGGAQAPDDDPD